MRFLRGALLVLAGLVFGCGLVELILRLTGVSFPSLYTIDPYTGTALRSGASGVYTEEGRGHVEVNAGGYRGPLLEKTKSEETTRLLLLGDSYVEAKQVDHHESLPFLLQASLPCERRTVEVLPLGVSGWGTAQELLALRHRLAGFEIDHVLLVFVSGNDVRNNIRELEQDSMRPYFAPREGSLALDDSFRASDAYRLREAASLAYAVIDHSRALELVAHVLNRRRIGDRGSGLDAEIYRAPAKDEWRRGWDVTEALILLIRDEAKTRGADFTLILAPNPIQAHPDPDHRKRYELENEADLAYPDRRLLSFSGEHGVKAMALADRMREEAERAGALYGFGGSVGDGHWNLAGHRTAARLIAEELCRDPATGPPPEAQR